MRWGLDEVYKLGKNLIITMYNKLKSNKIYNIVCIMYNKLKTDEKAEE